VWSKRDLSEASWCQFGAPIKKPSLIALDGEKLCSKYKYFRDTTVTVDQSGVTILNNKRTKESFEFSFSPTSCEPGITVVLEETLPRSRWKFKSPSLWISELEVSYSSRVGCMD
jgi:hypothetical protein